MFMIFKIFFLVVGFFIADDGREPGYPLALKVRRHLRNPLDA